MTTTVRGFAAATRATSSSCRFGRWKPSRSRPSVSQSGSRPTTTTAASAFRAAATARSIASSGSGGSQPSRRPPGVPGRSCAKSTSISTATPASSTASAFTSALPSPKNEVPGLRSSQLSRTARPSMRSRLLPALVSEKRCAPLSGGTSCARSRADHGCFASRPGGVCSQKTSASRMRSRRTGSPEGSAAAKSSTSIGSASGDGVRCVPSSAGTPRWALGPRSKTTSTPDPARARMPSSGDTA